MRIVHFGHACVLLETGSARLLLDPGTLASGFETVRGLDAILFTHQHHDHLDLDRLPALVAGNPDAAVVADPGSAEQINARGLSCRTARPGDTLSLGGVPVEVVGGDHAVIHPDLPNIPNVGYLVGHGAFLHPGDSFVLPHRPVDVLALPTGAPWLKASEAVDYLRAVRPRVAVPIHEAVLASPQLHHTLFQNLAPEGTEVRVLRRGELTEV
ncbi:L-ascorbate metabolism protein UlaG, beta-lactamase superfamily [Streptoalloteichus tenebrarius]|uniref:L-ascorbate metabolism protein UlaG, beta-lactamase superfamily n=1 Tax=Streptoalloteichus tenebrarius (strain ATCC 17920 / DSM 40477 / JCM 4838 / CBS 697.72 / NBRC 16177 / NCIMB 11028 / NRRL B-12390 / A12253. 1 / ISP 5477) TaxID=1933 RepID=A0ABT1HUY6_STRSD|nr:MBL fold metallo-hydrolase [Streptoalloteichus tenebrarius]MCP2259339.1 L-ascorbate metabolism protein UlaG, beta-lactamase superfamily [Streptoalloteichus tenebrarius]BFF02278.1 MBL fold metallo-hydrolase [Streptoalloteichus tenebrarius]